jgi:hypothetical protein
MTTTHAQTWIKANAKVDTEIAEIVKLLNAVEGLQTLQSCQGDEDQGGYVYFSLGEWENLCRFVFDRMAPRFRGHLWEDVKLEIIAAEEQPVAKISFSAEAIPQVAAALKDVVS